MSLTWFSVTGSLRFGSRTAGALPFRPAPPAAALLCSCLSAKGWDAAVVAALEVQAQLLYPLGRLFDH